MFDGGDIYIQQKFAKPALCLGRKWVLATT